MYGPAEAGSHPQCNNLLRALNGRDQQRLEPSLERFYAESGDVLYEPGDDVRVVYFPCGPSMVAFVIQAEEGVPVETALVGREGAVGGVVSQGRLPAYSRAVVQFPGEFLRISSAELEEAKHASLTLRHLFARYADCLFSQVLQSTACNATHTIEQRTAKWLIASIDRTGDHDIPLTQEQLAGMLGVGRTYISRVIQSLKTSGVLRTRRGGVYVEDLDRLRAMACGCHEAVRRHFDVVLKGVYPTEAESSDQKVSAGTSRPGSRMRDGGDGAATASPR